MSHFDLLYRFAESDLIDRWKNVVLVEPNMGPGLDGIPDVLTLTKSYSRREVRVFEVKFSESDLAGDCRKRKWEKYIQQCDFLYFVLGQEPAAVWKKYLLNEPVGIIVETKEGKFQRVRNGTRFKNRVAWTDDNWMALLMNGKRMDERTHSPRIARLERARESLLHAEIKKLDRNAVGKLGRWADELLEKELRLSKIEKNAREQAMKEVAQLLIGNKYFWSNKPEDIINDALLDPVRLLFSEKLRDLKKALGLELESGGAA